MNNKSNQKSEKKDIRGKRRRVKDRGKPKERQHRRLSKKDERKYNQ